MSASFGHIFGGGYAAGYYGYKWAGKLQKLDDDITKGIMELM